MSRLPDFVIIGAPKCATTWLTSNLIAQPEVHMPSSELHFFNRNYAKGLSWYSSHFHGARPGQIVGEKSASYLSDPAVPGRLRELLPNAKLIVQLRNPSERAYSDYCMLLRRGEVSRNIGEYLSELSAMPRFLFDGLYARHLKAFFAVYPREQIQILLYENIVADSAGVFQDVGRFLGLRDDCLTRVVGRRLKDRNAPTLPLPLRRMAAPLKPAVAPFRQQRWFKFAHGVLARPVRYPTFDVDLRARLQRYYANEIEELSALLNRDLREWRSVNRA